MRSARQYTGPSNPLTGLGVKLGIVEDTDELAAGLERAVHLPVAADEKGAVRHVGLSC